MQSRLRLQPYCNPGCSPVTLCCAGLAPRGRVESLRRLPLAHRRRRRAREALRVRVVGEAAVVAAVERHKRPACAKNKLAQPRPAGSPGFCQRPGPNPRLRAASANQPVGPCCPAISGVVSTPGRPSRRAPRCSSCRTLVPPVFGRCRYQSTPHPIGAAGGCSPHQACDTAWDEGALDGAGIRRARLYKFRLSAQRTTNGGCR